MIKGESWYNSFLANLNGDIEPDEDVAIQLTDRVAVFKQEGAQGMVIGEWGTTVLKLTDELCVTAYYRDRLRLTPPGQKTVSELVVIDDLIKTNYGTGPYRVEGITKNTYYGICEAYSLVLSDVNAPRNKNGELSKNYSYAVINEIVAQDGKLLMLFEANKDEVTVVGKAKIQRTSLSDFMEGGRRK